MLQTPEDFAAMDDPSASTSEIVAYRPEWRDEDIALVCGIANAGGGRIVISPNINDRVKKMKRFKKTFERIPQLAWRELGLTCSTEPVMNGMNLCLEIQVPAAPHPIRYGNNYYLYNEGINSIVPRELFDRLLAPNIETPQAATEVTQASRDAQTPNNAQAALQANEIGLADHRAREQESATSLSSSTVSVASAPSTSHKPTFNETSIAAANRLDMTITDEYILKVLETNGRVTALQIAKLLEISESTVRRSFRRLREYGFIERIGSNKAGYWRVLHK
ncbi:aAA-4 family protein [Eggerthella sp. CAG:298]|nr:aAA-4 family protein [Eggerthella sp. CAG:298]